MKVTIAVCTWNWAESLRNTLNSFLALKIPDGVEVEMIVVDNNSTDKTSEVIDSFLDRLPLKKLFESKQGLSHARNCAIDAAQGELILFTDHDAVVAPDWLEAYYSASQRWPEASYFGGRITPMYEADPPVWVVSHLNLLEGAILIRNLGTEERKLLPNEQVFGANLIFRREVFDHWRFDAKFGPAGTELILGDETMFLENLKNHGKYGVWVPAAKVKHFVPRKRVSTEFVKRYFVGLGRTNIRVSGPPGGKKLFGAPRALFRQWGVATVKAHLLKWTGMGDWFPHFLYASEVRGMIIESQKQFQQTGK